MILTNEFSHHIKPPVVFKIVFTSVIIGQSWLKLKHKPLQGFGHAGWLGTK
jgi:hypothetical protein